ncbi:MAG TPA: hypothetical protein PK876_05865 [Elusimicrobiota bacterium]|nr:hypothetical protein [Elusimicrobiota bacterium]
MAAPNKKESAATPSNRLMGRIPALWRDRLRLLGDISQTQGSAACLVGGSVRDLYLRVPSLDWDVVVEGSTTRLLQELAKRWSSRITWHPSFLTATVHFPDGTTMDVASARRETYVQPAALPIVEPAALREDFQRRDFSVNAMALHVTPDRWGDLEDPFQGRLDVDRKTLRILHAKSFEDDPTRLFRLIRYAGRFNFRPSSETRTRMEEAFSKKYADRLSPARKRAELEAMAAELKATPVFERLFRWGGSVFFDPAWAWTPFHRRCLDALSPDSREDRILYRWLVLSRYQTPAEAQNACRRLETPKETTISVRRSLEILNQLEKDQVPMDSRWDNLAPVVQEFIRKALPRSSPLRRFERSRPLLTGDDLLRLGYKPGKLYHAIFEKIRRERWSGRMKTRAQEIQFIIDNFPRND